MQRRTTKRQTKSQPSNGKKQAPAANSAGRWSNRPGENLSVLLSRVRAAQVMRLHFR
jgi:hypothetical protein